MQDLRVLRWCCWRC